MNLELLIGLWRCAFQYRDVAKNIEEKLYNCLWSDGKECEESWFAKYERVPNQVTFLKFLLNNALNR